MRGIFVQEQACPARAAHLNKPIIVRGLFQALDMIFLGQWGCAPELSAPSVRLSRGENRATSILFGERPGGVVQEQGEVEKAAQRSAKHDCCSVPSRRHREPDPTAATAGYEKDHIVVK
eukprot:1139865-Pelagomonas_calceolata.AAC.7